MTTEIFSPKERLQRAKSLDSIDRTAVRAALSPVRELLASLQQRVAILSAEASHLGDTRPLAPKVADLSVEIENASARFNLIVSSLPPEQRSHGQVIDLQRALARIRQSVPTSPA